jgi:FtsZ-binding cell division protein ZapB
MEEGQPAEKRSNEKIYLGIIALLVVICGILTWKVFDYRTYYENISVQRDNAEKDRNQLRSELQEMLKQYDELKTDNEKVTSEMLAQKEQIKDLLDQVEKNKGNVTLIARYKKEVVTLRTVMRSYVVTIDSLNTLNQQLSTENTQVKEELGSERNKTQQLQGQTQEMAGIIAKASVLKANSISVTGIRLRTTGSQVETDRAANTEIFRACFQVAENSTARPGSRVIYLRIMRPDGSVISAGETSVFEGTTGSYSARKDIDYNNKAEELCMYANAPKGMAPGKYLLHIFESGTRIGSSSITLK